MEKLPQVLECLHVLAGVQHVSISGFQTDSAPLYGITSYVSQKGYQALKLRIPLPKSSYTVEKAGCTVMANSRVINELTPKAVGPANVNTEVNLTGVTLGAGGRGERHPVGWNQQI